MLVQAVRFADLPYFVGLASMTIYIGAHRGLTTRLRQQISLREVWVPPPIFWGICMHARPARTLVAATTRQASNIQVDALCFAGRSGSHCRFSRAVWRVRGQSAPLLHAWQLHAAHGVVQALARQGRAPGSILSFLVCWYRYLCASMSRYLLIKLFPDLSLQRFLDAYFWLIGSLAVAGNLIPPLRHAVRAPASSRLLNAPTRDLGVSAQRMIRHPAAALGAADSARAFMM